MHRRLLLGILNPSMSPRALLLPLFLASAALADGPADNIPASVRPVPPPGVAIPDDVRKSLTEQAAKLAEAIEAARTTLKDRPTLAFLPDVQIFHKAVDWALRYNEFFDVAQTQWARDQLAAGFDRLNSLLHNETPWLHARGLVPRGYLSKIDGSIQPFGLVIPESFNPNLPHRWRLDAWFHGRGEKLSELDFIHQRQSSTGEFAPPDTIVLHPYGRYCNGSRFAGETDFFEALATVQRDYRIDPDRIVVRGFSLGGAACWHFATHHAPLWAAANPGAGFSETEQFLNFFQGESLKPHPWERLLWNLYDSTSVAGNLRNCPTVAYSGETDRQKQAADLMAAAAQPLGITLTHLIGPKTAHSYEKTTKAEVARRIDHLASLGRSNLPLSVDFTTFSLHTNQTPIGTIDALGEHWKPARLRAAFLLAPGNGPLHQLAIITENITALTISLPPGSLHTRPLSTIIIKSPDASTPFHLEPTLSSDGSLSISAHLKNGAWTEGPNPEPGLRKSHGLQGPIDDAFTDSFLFVRPTSKPANEKAAAWAQSEMDRAIREWRRHFRGDARVKPDTDISEADIASSNLILWGDPSSNSLISRISARLPIAWSPAAITAGPQSFPATDHALVCIYPNPLNPNRYVVLNSSFTFREYDYLNNARQTPKLPDWAIINLNTPPDSRYPGAIPAAGFFNEHWELKP